MMMHRSKYTLACLVLTALPVGCSSRRVYVTSEPPGATVCANDVELGRTPLWADFTYYGTYDVLLTLDGYEPLRTSAKARAPVYEYPPFDLVAAPFEPDTTIRWHFTLTPALESTMGREALEAALLERARAMRTSISDR